MIIEFKELIAEAVKKVEQGDKTAYPVYVELRDLVKFLTDAMSQIKGQVFEEIGEEKKQYDGYEIQKRNGSIEIKKLKSTL